MRTNFDIYVFIGFSIYPADYRIYPGTYGMYPYDIERIPKYIRENRSGNKEWIIRGHRLYWTQYTERRHIKQAHHPEFNPKR